MQIELFLDLLRLHTFVHIARRDFVVVLIHQTLTVNLSSVSLEEHPLLCLVEIAHNGISLILQCLFIEVACVPHCHVLCRVLSISVVKGVRLVCCFGDGAIKKLH